MIRNYNLIIKNYNYKLYNFKIITIFYYYRSFKKYENGLDLGIKPAHGLKPPKPKVNDMNKELKKSNQGIEVVTFFAICFSIVFITWSEIRI